MRRAPGIPGIGENSVMKASTSGKRLRTRSTLDTKPEVRASANVNWMSGSPRPATRNASSTRFMTSTSGSFLLAANVVWSATRTSLRRLAEALLVRPEAEGRVGDVEDVFAGNGVPAVAQLVGVVPLQYLVERSVAVVHGLDFFARQMAGAVGNGEAALGGAVDQVGGGAEVGGEIGVALHG